LVRIVRAGLAWRRARATGWTLALAGAAPALSRWWCSPRRGTNTGTQSLVERLGVPVFVPPPDTADDLVRKYGITPEQAGGGSPDVAWVLAGDGGEAHLYGVLRGDGAQVVQRAAE